MIGYVLVALMAVQTVILIYMVCREERRARRTDPVIEAIYQDALKTLAEHAKTLQR